MVKKVKETQTIIKGKNAKSTEVQERSNANQAKGVDLHGISAHFNQTKTCWRRGEQRKRKRRERFLTLERLRVFRARFTSPSLHLQNLIYLVRTYSLSSNFQENRVYGTSTFSVKSIDVIGCKNKFEFFGKQ